MESHAKHWTGDSTDAFVYRISSDFILQLEKKMNGELSQNELATRLGVSKGRVSQVLNNPGNLTLKKMVQYSRALGMKVAVLAYDDGDPDNKRGPINSEVFTTCWKRSGSPRDFFALSAALWRAQESVPRFLPVREVIMERTSSSAGCVWKLDLSSRTDSAETKGSPIVETPEVHLDA